MRCILSGLCFVCSVFVVRWWLIVFDCCCLLIVCWLLIDARCSLRILRGVLFGVSCLLVVCCLLLCGAVAVYCVLFWCGLCVVRYFVFASCCYALFVIDCWFVRCQLLVVRCSLLVARC